MKRNPDPDDDVLEGALGFMVDVERTTRRIGCWRMVQDLVDRLGITWEDAYVLIDRCVRDGLMRQEGGHSVALEEKGRDWLRERRRHAA